MKNKSHRKMLNKKDPKIEPWETPNTISAQELKVQLF